MSFLAGRVAASEGAYFNETSKHAIARLREKAAASNTLFQPSTSSSLEEAAIAADVLPEILQHSLPLPRACLQADLQHYSLPSQLLPSPSSLAASLSSTAPPPRLPPHAYHVNLDTTGLYAFSPNLPQCSFGPRRWKPPVEEELKLVASTANQARMEGFPTMDDTRVEAFVEGYSTVMRAFLIATALIVGGSSIAVGTIASKAQIHSVEDIRTKGHEHIRPWAKAIDKRFEPWKQWVHQHGVGWRMGDQYRIDGTAPFAEVFGLRTAPVREEVNTKGGASKGN
ncbi:hypothetical protein GOP47_0015228 [Adiantum capillus-veneris]|uniref:Uncharacterized protein n=1 Tax=Adiantum capillus-veneris TaxID=13818 RepID=A0A9D4UJL5_ADICA|nr:hypothetical protein GOP47_0015228 [Adiantum capillus-veneris]